MTCILVVCTGNVCRSPIAEGLLRDTLRARLGEEAPSVSSAGPRGGKAPLRCPDPSRRQPSEAWTSPGTPPGGCSRARRCRRPRDRDVDEHRTTVMREVPEASGRTFTLKELVRLLEALPAADPLGDAQDTLSDRVRRADMLRGTASRATRWTMTSWIPSASRRRATVPWPGSWGSGADGWSTALRDGSGLVRHRGPGSLTCASRSQRPRGVPPEGGREGLPRRGGARGARCRHGLRRAGRLPELQRGRRPRGRGGQGRASDRVRRFGQGEQIAANKVHGVRAPCARSVHGAPVTEHNDANVLAMADGSSPEPREGDPPCVADDPVPGWSPRTTHRADRGDRAGER